MSYFKRYSKDALLCNFRNIKVTCNIIRHQIKEDGFVIHNNKSWGTWYLIKQEYKSPHCDTQGNFNVFEKVGQHVSELELLFYYLNKYM